MKDPFKIVQKILEEVFNHLLFYIQEKFKDLFGILSPTVTGVKEAIHRIKKQKLETGANPSSWSDLYSNCNDVL